MKVDELMVGDWVLLDDKPYQLKSGKEIDELALKVKPIPISLEFMKSQGYTSVSDWDFEVFKLNKSGVDLLFITSYYLNIYTTGEAVIYAAEGHNGKGEQQGWQGGTYDESIWMIHCDTVHELQHFIKFAGIKKEIVL